MSGHYDIGKILESYREKNKLNLREMGDLTGVSFSYLGKMEKGLIPSKEIVLQIAERLNLSPYRLLTAAGFIVDLRNELSIDDLDLYESQIIDLVEIKYRIYALPNLEQVVNLRRLINWLPARIGANHDTFREIIRAYQYVTLSQATDICVNLNLKFEDLFRVVSLNNEALIEEGQIALQIDKYIEYNRQEKLLETENNLEHVKEFVSYQADYIVRELIDSQYNLNNVDEILTIDEMIYLRECLELYRRLKLKSE